MKSRSHGWLQIRTKEERKEYVRELLRPATKNDLIWLVSDVILLTAVMGSGAVLSILFVPEISLKKALLLLLALILGVVLASREHWLRLGAFAFLFAGIFGVGQILSDYGHHFLYGEPLFYSEHTYIIKGALCALYLAAWCTWWLWLRQHHKSRT